MTKEEGEAFAGEFSTLLKKYGVTLAIANVVTHCDEGKKDKDGKTLFTVRQHKFMSSAYGKKHIAEIEDAAEQASYLFDQLLKRIGVVD